MKTKDLGLALFTLGSIIAAIWGFRFYDVAKECKYYVYPIVSKGDSLFFRDIHYQDAEVIASNSLAVALVGLGILAFGALLVFFSSSDSNTNTSK